MKRYRIGVIAGDGIGPEVIEAALVVLDAVEKRFGFATERTPLPWSGQQYLATKTLPTAADFETMRGFDGMLLGAVGDPRVERGLLEREVLLEMRRRLDLYVNLRPIELYSPSLSPLRTAGAEQIDIAIVRENTEDVYASPGKREQTGTAAEFGVSEMRFTRRATERIVRHGYETAAKRPRKSLTLVDKANAVPIMGIYRDVLEALSSEFPDVRRSVQYVDAAAMFMVLEPARFDTIVTTNLFGDILSDLGAALVGGLGVAASGNIHPGGVAVFEPIHGSAPEFARQGKACPVGAFGSVAMLLDHVGEVDAARSLKAAIRGAFASGAIRDVGMIEGGTETATKAVLAVLAD